MLPAVLWGSTMQTSPLLTFTRKSEVLGHYQGFRWGCGRLHSLVPPEILCSMGAHRPLGCELPLGACVTQHQWPLTRKFSQNAPQCPYEGLRQSGTAAALLSQHVLATPCVYKLRPSSSHSGPNSANTASPCPCYSILCDAMCDRSSEGIICIKCWLPVLRNGAVLRNTAPT